jgi:hypothetical protein
MGILAWPRMDEVKNLVTAAPEIGAVVTRFSFFALSKGSRGSCG